jgi:hypothetical protein
MTRFLDFFSAGGSCGSLIAAVRSRQQPMRKRVAGAYLRLKDYDTIYGDIYPRASRFGGECARGFR